MYRFKDENKNKTLSSIRRFPGENAYEITYYGDYAMDEYLKCGAADIDALLDFQRTHLYEDLDIKALYSAPHNCSGFTAHNAEGDFLLCHDLDTRLKMPNVTLAENKVTGKTVGLANTLLWAFWDKYPEYPDVPDANDIVWERALGVPYEMYDGMNEHGLAIVTFTASGTEVGSFGNKIPLCYDSFRRAILDRCKTVDEVCDFLEHYVAAALDYHDHSQIADASGKSIIVEYIDGKEVIIPNEKPYQICSNFLIYDNPRLDGFGKERYLAYQEYLDSHNGIVDEETAFRLLHENHIEGDENYSVVFNLTKRTAAVQFAPDFAVTHKYQL